MANIAPVKGDYLCVALDLYSRSNLEPLVAALGKNVFVLHSGRNKRTYHARFQLSKCKKNSNADFEIRSFRALLDDLEPVGRLLWDSAKIRDFDIGVEAPTTGYCFIQTLEAETLRTASEVGARIIFTVYPYDNNRFSEMERVERKIAESDAMVRPAGE
jgi:hypothetical protein